MEKRLTLPPSDVSFAGLASLRGGGIEITVVEGVDKGKILRTEQLPVLIGRAPDNDLHAPLDRKMSRQHAKIVQQGNRYFLEDLGSTNGTFLRDAKVSQATELFHGDHFICGETIFRFALKEQDLPHEDSTVIVSAPEELVSSVFATHLREAIVVLDMCNSSALANQFGDEQAMNVKRELRRLYLPIVRRWGAQFVKNTGDGYLVTFARAHDAVGSSVQILQYLRDHNPTVPPHEQLRLRFGLNCGETLVDADGDRHGNAVNVAFRVEGVREEQRSEGSEGRESLRPEDRVYITAVMYAELPSAAQAACRSLGRFALKGIAEQQLLYEVQWESVDCALLGS
jgi:class 3 adenylate cyclase